MVFVFMLSMVIVSAQKNIQEGPHKGDLMSLGDIQIEMVKESYSCAIHQNKGGNNNKVCEICASKFERNKKVVFYFFDNSLRPINVANVKGRVRIVFKDGTETSKKIRVTDTFIWIPLGYNGLDNYLQAFVKLKFNKKEYKVTFGHPIVHNGHHH